MIKLHISLHVKYRHSCHILKEREISWQILQKYSYIKFNENSSLKAVLFHASRRSYRQTDMTKLIVGFYSFANTPKNNR